MTTTKNIKIENARKILGVGEKSIEIEDDEKHYFIASAKNKDEIMKELQPSLIVEEGETALKPLIYTLSDGVIIKGLSKKTKDKKIIGVIKVELANGLTFMHNKETIYNEFNLFEKDVEDVTKSLLTSYIKYHTTKENEGNSG